MVYESQREGIYGQEREKGPKKEDVEREALINHRLSNGPKLESEFAPERYDRGRLSNR